MVGQPDAVSEQSPAGERARRVNGNDPDGRVTLANVPDERADEARLPDAGRSGDADRVRIAGLGLELPDKLVRGRG
jgi:hypothetical protein